MQPRTSPSRHFLTDRPQRNAATTYLKQKKARRCETGIDLVNLAGRLLNSSFVKERKCTVCWLSPALRASARVQATGADLFAGDNSLSKLALSVCFLYGRSSTSSGQPSGGGVAAESRRSSSSHSSRVAASPSRCFGFCWNPARSRRTLRGRIGRCRCLRACRFRR